MMAQNNQAKPTDSSLVPTSDEAGRMYEENRGHLTLDDEFGRDPLAATLHWYKHAANSTAMRDFFTQLNCLTYLLILLLTVMFTLL